MRCGGTLGCTMCRQCSSLMRASKASRPTSFSRLMASLASVVIVQPRSATHTCSCFYVPLSAQLRATTGLTKHPECTVRTVAVGLGWDVSAVVSGVAQLKHYRFWSSSLLWVYDGGLSDPEERKASLDIRMIDFANTIYLRGEITAAAAATCPAAVAERLR